MRISDWSSDVCSSDLKHALRQAAIPLPSVSDDDKRVHAVIKASFEQALEFIDDRLIEITPKPVGLRKKQHTEVDRKRAARAACARRCSPAGGRRATHRRDLRRSPPRGATRLGNGG